MVKIRLTRKGAKKSPFYRVVVAHDTSPRDGRFIENLGYYSPTKDPQVVELKEDRVLHWLSQGAVPSDTARSLFRKKGILQRLSEQKAGAAQEPGSED
ncbi:MAG: 30S ribosomal protein S16 [bacterium]|nr:30S ribosomal protein S16 [bacterium]